MRRWAILGVMEEERSNIIRPERPCSRRAVQASKPRVPAPPVTLGFLLVGGS